MLDICVQDNLSPKVQLEKAMKSKLSPSDLRPLTEWPQVDRINRRTQYASATKSSPRFASIRIKAALIMFQVSTREDSWRSLSSE